MWDMSYDLQTVGTARAAAAPGTSHLGSEESFDRGGGLLFLPACSVTGMFLAQLGSEASAHSADASQEGQIERVEAKQ